MANKIGLLLAALILASVTWASEPAGSVAAQQNQPQSADMCEVLDKSKTSADELAGRGCCSHHGGVCGCGGTRLQCCDGSLSPSCVCAKGDPEGAAVN